MREREPVAPRVVTGNGEGDERSGDETRWISLRAWSEDCSPMTVIAQHARLRLRPLPSASWAVALAGSCGLACLACSASHPAVPALAAQQPSPSRLADCPARAGAQLALEQGRPHRALYLVGRAATECDAARAPDERGRQSTMALRIEALSALGRFDQAERLLAGLPPSDPDTRRLRNALAQRRATWQSASPESLRDRASGLPATDPVRRELLEQAFELAQQRTRDKPRIDVPEGVRRSDVGGDLRYISAGPDPGTLFVAEATRIRTIRTSDHVTVRMIAVPLGYRLHWIAPSGSVALIRSATDFRLWRPANNEMLPAATIAADDQIWAVTASDDTERFALALNTGSDRRNPVFVWDGSSWSPTEAGPGLSVTAVALSSDARLLAIGADSGQLIVRDRTSRATILRTATHASVFEPSDATQAMSFAPVRMLFDQDARNLLVETRDFGMRLYAVRGNAQLLAQDLGDFSSWERKPKRGTFGVQLIAGLRASAASNRLWDNQLPTAIEENVRKADVGYSGIYLGTNLSGSHLDIPAADLHWRISPSTSAVPWFVRAEEQVVHAGPDSGRARPWLACRYPVGTAGWLPSGAIIAACGEEVVIGTTAGPGARARLRAIRTSEQATFALFDDGTAQAWGDLSLFHKVALCIVGELALPLEACADELMVKGRLEQLILGAPPTGK